MAQCFVCKMILTYKDKQNIVLCYKLKDNDLNTQTSQCGDLCEFDPLYTPADK